MDDLAASGGAFPSPFVYLPGAALGASDQPATVFAERISGRTQSIVQVALAQAARSFPIALVWLFAPVVVLAL